MKNIAVTGYFWSGSSAVLDLLSEYDNVTEVPMVRDSNDYEHVAFYFGGGLFDLCNHLSRGNTVVGSDYAINVFFDSMKRLYDNRFSWFGSYKYLTGDKFLRIAEDFINEIAVSFEGTNLNHAAGTRLSIKKTARKALSNLAHIRFTNPCVLERVDNHNKVYVSLPTEEELINASRKYSNAYFDLFTAKEGSDYRLFDHLIWPQQIEEFGKYLPQDLSIIVVQRDVRDIYVLNKYLNSRSFFPTNISDFVDVYKRVIVSNDNPRVTSICFEDLIYNYDKIEHQLESLFGLNHGSHNKKYQFFDPSRSIENTQVHRCKQEWIEETLPLIKELPELCFDFPYNRVPDIEKVMGPAT